MAEPVLEAIARSYREDAEFRAAVETDARAALAARGLDVADWRGELRVAVDTGETVHVVFPPDPHAVLPDGALDGVAGGHALATAAGRRREAIRWGTYLGPR